MLNYFYIYFLSNFFFCHDDFFFFIHFSFLNSTNFFSFTLPQIVSWLFPSCSSQKLLIPVWYLFPLCNAPQNTPNCSSNTFRQSPLQKITSHHYVTFFCQLQTTIHHSLFIYKGQAVNLCLRRGVRFAHPCLQHGFKACRGLRPRTPGCIPTLSLAALYLNINLGCPKS
jgi:hypothetical protein